MEKNLRKSVKSVDKKSMKIGLFGGSFDPPHNGHISAARAALEKAGLAAVVFVPARISPLKIGQMRAPDADRLAMLRLAVADEPRFRVSDFELLRPGVSFTIDTVRHFISENPDDEFHLIIGADSLATFHHWKDADEIARLCRIIILARDGSPHSDNAEFTFVNDFDCPVSSTEIRRIVSSSAPIPADYIPPAVAGYIRRHALYK